MIEDCACGHRGHPVDQRNIDGSCPLAACGCQTWRPVSQVTLPPLRREVVVQVVAFSEVGIDIQWMVLPDDVRSEGHVVHSRQTSISYATPAGLGEAAVDLRTAVDALGALLDIQLEQLPVSDPAQTETLGYQGRQVEVDDDEDVGMGDGR